MIDESRTLEIYGYTSDDLSHASGKKVVAVCDGCGKYRVVRFCGYRDLCMSCERRERGERRFKEFLAEHKGKHFCACGCGEAIKIDYECYVHNRFPKYIHGHNSRGHTHPMYKSEIDEWVKENTNKHLCKCGCGEFIKIERRFYYKGIPEYIHNHHVKEMERTEEWSERISVALKTSEACKRIHSSEEWRRKQSDSHRGKKQSIETIEKRTKRGEDHPNWRGGISFGKYCPKFNEKTKREVREKYNNCDFVSGLSNIVCNNGEQLSVHHVDYDKQQGCDDHEWRLIPLSRSNHAKTNYNRSFWNRLFTYALQYWNTYYGDDLNSTTFSSLRD